MTVQYLAVGTTTTAYESSGEGEPLVLLHGGESHRGEFDPFRPLLGPGIRAIAYDQRDTGQTANGTEPYDVWALAADCAALIKGLGLGRAHVLGASFGGGIAMHLAIAHPEVVRTLTVAAAVASVELDGEQARELLRMSPDERARHMLNAVISPAGQDDGALMDHVRRALSGRTTRPGSPRMTAIRGMDCTGRLGEITAPTLVLQGTDDPLVPVAYATRLAEAIPGARLELVAGARHGITLEYGAEAARLTRDLIMAHPITR